MSDLSRRLDRLPFTRFHRKLLLIGGSGYMFDAMDVAIIGFVLPIITVQWHLGGGVAGMIAGSSAIGGIGGALLAGRLGDLFGRRIIMMWALAIYALATLAGAFAVGWHSFLLARIIAGIGTSAESVIIAPFVAEFAPARLRGRVTGALTGFFSFGFLAAAFLGWAVIPSSAMGWRIALAITAAPIVLLLWWRRGLPESPRWLEQNGRAAEAEAIVAAIEAQSGALPSEERPIVARQVDVATKGGIGDLISRTLLRRTLIVCLLWGAMGFCYYAFMTWIPSLLVMRGFGIARSFGLSIAIYAAQTPGYFSAAWLNDRIGRKAVIASYMGLAALSALVLAISATAPMVVASSMLLSFAMNGAYAGLYSYTPELFPTSVRATAQGIATAISRVGAMVSPILVGLLFPAFGFVGVFGTAVAILGAGAVIALAFGPSTSGLSLDDAASES